MPCTSIPLLLFYFLQKTVDVFFYTWRSVTLLIWKLLSISKRNWMSAILNVHNFPPLRRKKNHLISKTLNITCQSCRPWSNYKSSETIYKQHIFTALSPRSLQLVQICRLPFSIMAFTNNSSTNGTQEFQGHDSQSGSCSLSPDAEAITISHASIYSVLLLSSLIGNSLLIYSTLKSNIKMNRIIANIAFSDLLFSTVHFPREIVTQIRGDSPTFLVSGWIGSLFCKIAPFVTDSSVAVSTFSLVLIAADRLVAIVYPTRFRLMTVKTRRLQISCTWILAMAIHSPYFYTFRLEATSNGETICNSNWEPAFDHESTSLWFYTMLLVTVLIIPLVTVATLQTIVLVKLRSDDMAAFRTSIANQRQAQRNKKLVIMSAVIVLAFAICWLPFLVNTFLRLYFPASIPDCSLGSVAFRQFAMLFSFCHVLANPCVCFTFMRRLRVFRIPKNTLRKSSTYVETRLWQFTIPSYHLNPSLPPRLLSSRRNGEGGRGWGGGEPRYEKENRTAAVN